MTFYINDLESQDRSGFKNLHIGQVFKLASCYLMKTGKIRAHRQDYNAVYLETGEFEYVSDIASVEPVTIEGKEVVE